jgi:hypothetical protein
MGRRLAGLVSVAVVAVAALPSGGAAGTTPQCKPGEPLRNDPRPDNVGVQDTVPPIVIGCWNLSGGKVTVHGRRSKVGTGDAAREYLCLGTPNKVVCLNRWPPKKGTAIAGTSCGGGNGFIFVEGTVSDRVRRVDVRFRDAEGTKRTRRASVVWMRGKVAEKLRTRSFGYYRGETAKGARVIETLARDADGRVLGRLKGSSCNEPR